MVAQVTPKVIQYQVGRSQRSMSAVTRSTGNVTHKTATVS
ncbi:hypothetical protein SAVIM40S_02011 [Streptomyces avidinii]